MSYFPHSISPGSSSISPAGSPAAALKPCLGRCPQRLQDNIHSAVRHVFEAASGSRLGFFPLPNCFQLYGPSPLLARPLPLPSPCSPLSSNKPTSTPVAVQCTGLDFLVDRHLRLHLLEVCSSFKPPARPSVQFYPFCFPTDSEAVPFPKGELRPINGGFRAAAPA